MGIEYYGTSANSIGHYFYEEKEGRLKISKRRFESLPFNPEKTFKPIEPFGLVRFFVCGGYKIMAISGSCRDKRLGSKSVFFTNDNISLGKLREEVLTIPCYREIIAKMPFNIMGIQLEEDENK